VKTNDAVAEPLKIPGIRYLEIKLTGKAFEKHLLSQLSWPSYLKLIFLYIFGFRMKAISIMGREVMQPRGLVGLASDTLDHSGVEIKEV
jgi:protein-tyrosine phosphatase